MNITEEEISAMKARLKSRQEDRRLEADIDEVIALVGKHRAAGDAEKPEQKVTSHEILAMARRMKLIEDVSGVVIIAAWAICSGVAVISWRTGTGSPGIWLAAAEICLLPYLARIPNDVCRR